MLTASFGRGRIAGPDRGADMAAAPASQVRRIAIVGPNWRSLVRLRGDLIAALIERRHRILCLAPSDQGSDRDFTLRLKTLGAECTSFPFEADGFRPLADGRTVVALARRLAGWQAQIVLGYRPKPMLLGALAGRRARVEHVVTLVSTLGPELGGPDPPHWLWRRLLRAGFAASDQVVFHNHADLQRLRALDVLPEKTAVTVVPGAGVDLERHMAHPLPPMNRGITFLMLAPFQREKGTLAFCAAARQVRAWRPDARFILAGPDGTGEGAVSSAELADYAGFIEVRGDSEDVRPLFAEAHVVVLPSIREGMARSLLEALANGRPIITTNVPGCRETVDELVNGILVPPQDVDALAAAMRYLIERRTLLKQMAHASRLKAERLFDVRHVNAALMTAMRLD